MDYKDYYKIMGLARTASPEEIKRAYRKLARKYHPDVSKEPNAESKFKELGEAYEVLKDPEKRTNYDTYGQQWKEAGSQSHSQRQYRPQTESPGGFEDFLNHIFRQRYQREQAETRAEDSHAKLTISLEDSFQGATKILQLQRPTLTAGSLDYQTHTIHVKIPKGIQDKQAIRLKGQGDNNGDLYIEINFAPHPLYSVNKKDILLKTPISPWEAALGLSIQVPTLGGFVHLKIPPFSQTGKKMRLKGRGLPGNPPGDQLIIFEIVIPDSLNPEAQDLYEKLSKCYNFNPRKNLGAGHGKS